ncbi:MAG: hypothetical protein P3X22_003070 [Thermoprotei archaeon]|nr:hypothetical protein [Thermoprotei archaeon]
MSFCRYFSSEDTLNKFTGDILFSTGFYGKLWLVKYKYVYVDNWGRKEVLQDNVLAVWMEPKFNSDNRIDAQWEVDDNPNDGNGVTENVLRILRSNITYKSLSEPEKGGYWLPIRTIFENSGASWRFGAGILVGALTITLAGVTSPVIAAIASIAVSLSVGIEAGGYTGDLYESLGSFKIELLKSYRYYYVYGSYAEFKNTYTVKDDADRVVPLFIFSPFIRS